MGTSGIAVVTGASSGLGLATAAALAARGMTLVLAARDRAKGETAQLAVPGSQLVVVDLASLASVRSAARDLAQRFAQVDVLINNAGVMATPPGRTVDGFEMQLGTNHLGHFLWTAMLAPVLSSSARVINVSSRGHLISGMDWSDPHYRARPYNKWQAYGQSKTANILFTRGLAARGFTSVAVHPGAIDTNLYRHLSAEELANARGTGSSPLQSIDEGVASIVWAAAARDLANGAYVADCAVADAAPHAVDDDQVEQLWAWSESEVGQAFPARSLP